MLYHSSIAQLSRDSIHTDFVMYQRRLAFDKNLREQTIYACFAGPLNSSTEDKYREACWALSQFLINTPEVDKGFRKIFTQYASLENSTQRAFLEAVYAIFPSQYNTEINNLVLRENNPKLFAMQVLYLFRMDGSNAGRENLLKLLSSRFPEYKKNTVLTELENYLLNHESFSKQALPVLNELFDYRKIAGLKTIYSFQRWNRDYPGLAVVQNADGRFLKDGNGKLLVFEQLARSGSNLPYFITNGSTPQGIYSIQGTAVSHNNFIGPTPNIQLIMPNEADSVFWHSGYDSSRDLLGNYLSLLPESWRNYSPLTEAFVAGKAGRTEIIAHGTTIDPDYFKDKPYYPLTPTLGCLCAKEDWNIFNGKFLSSDQFSLVNGFLSTPGNKGYLFVINLNNQAAAVSRDEIEAFVKAFEQ